MHINSVDVGRARAVENEPMGDWKTKGVIVSVTPLDGSIFLASLANGADQVLIPLW